MSWDPLQREILGALGHTVYGLAGATPSRLPNDPLLHALLKAAGCNADDGDAVALGREWMPTSRLHAPAAKRALWPRLRALRSRSA